MRGVPGGFRYVNKETGFRVAAENYNAWIQRANKFYTDNGLDTTDLVRIMEDELCKSLPKGFCTDPALPTISTQAGYLGRTIARSIKGLLRGERLKASDDLAQERLAICKECPKFRSSDQRCSVCGCRLRDKAHLALEHCPIEKW